MDRLTQNKQAVKQLLLEVSSTMPTEDKGVENQLIIDEERGHFLIFGVGWELNKWFYATFLHIDVKENGNVWLQHNGTDLDMIAWLHRLGVPKQEIVLGFHSPSVREMLVEEEGYAKG